MPDSAPVETAVVPVAGRGSRLGPLCGTVPKELFPLGRSCVLHHVADELESAGIKRIILVTSPAKPAIAHYVERVLRPALGCDIELAFQGEVPGNGGAILTGAERAGREPFLVVWGDEIFLQGSRTQELFDAYLRSGRPTIALARIRDDEVSKCGIAVARPLSHGRCRIERILEKPAPAETTSRLASVGGFLVNDDLVEVLRTCPPRPDGEVYLSTALSAYAATAPLDGTVLNCDWYETGSFEGYARTAIALALRERTITADTVRACLSRELPATRQ